MRSHISRWRFVLLLAVFALVAAACGSGDEVADDTTTTTEAATTTTAAETTETTEAAEPAEPVAPPSEEGEVLSGLTIVDENTFTVELNAADPEFPLWLSYTAFFPLPTVVYENTFGFNELPIGNGPLMMDGKWNHDVEINLVANPDYMGERPVSIDAVKYLIIKDNAVAYNEALGGNLDVLTNIPADNLAIAPTDFPDRYAQSARTSYTYAGFPSYVAEFTKEHRQALSMAVDRQLIVDKIFAGSGVPAHSAIPPVLQGRDDVCPSWNYDPATAKEIWDAAQAAAPIDEITFWYNTGSSHELWIEAIVNMWGQNLGLDTSKVKFEGREWADYLDNLKAQGATGPFRLGWGMDYPSPLNFLEPLYASYNTPPEGSNNTFYNNPEFDALIASGKEKVAAAGDLAAGLPDYYAAEEILCEDAGIMPVYFKVNEFVWNEDVDEVHMDAFGNVDFSKITSEDGTVTVELNEPRSLIPQDANESEATQVLMAGVFSGLVGFDSGTGEMFMEHAESITSDDGGKTWTIVLKPGWTFHNGEPVTAQSYVDAWSFGAKAKFGWKNNSFFKPIVGYAELNPEA
ncbi:MAG: ABC transporter substrate-binding protein [Actinomycetota bacterium]